jgi:hypothetical protein
VYSAPTGLTGCYGFNGLGHYTGTEIKSSAIAASSASIFAEGLGPQRLYDEKAGAIRRALAALIPGKLDSVKHLRLFSLKLERQDIVVVQRSMADLAGTKRLQPSKLVFMVGTMEDGAFHGLHWNDSDGEDEQILGSVRLKSGRDFLVTTVSDSESQSFRVYEIRNGNLTLIYSGGGSSC